MNTDVLQRPRLTWLDDSAAVAVDCRLRRVFESNWQREGASPGGNLWRDTPDYALFWELRIAEQNVAPGG